MLVYKPHFQPYQPIMSGCTRFHKEFFFYLTLIAVSKLSFYSIADFMVYWGLKGNEAEELKLDDVEVNGNIQISVREGKHGK